MHVTLGEISVIFPLSVGLPIQQYFISILGFADPKQSFACRCKSIAAIAVFSHFPTGKTPTLLQRLCKILNFLQKHEKTLWVLGKKLFLSLGYFQFPKLFFYLSKYLYLGVIGFISGFFFLFRFNFFGPNYHLLSFFSCVQFGFQFHIFLASLSLSLSLSLSFMAKDGS